MNMKTRIATLIVVVSTILAGHASSLDDALPESCNGLSSAEVVALLPNDSYALIRSTIEVPDSWPSEIKEIAMENLVPV